jgi:hypothetical protein
MRTPLNNTRMLGRLVIRSIAQIVEGGAEFGEDGSGYFIPRTGMAYPVILAGDCGTFQVEGGQDIPLRDLRCAASTANLPRHYTFTCVWAAPKARRMMTCVST